MAALNTNTNMNTNTNEQLISTSEDKSLLSKAKDTLIGLKDQALGLFRYKYSDPNKVEIKGMSKADFEATKVLLESRLHLKGMKGYNSYPKWFDQSWSQWNNEFESRQSQFQSSTEFDSSKKFNNNEKSGQLQGEYQQVKKEEWMQPPQKIFEQAEVKDDRRDEMKFGLKDRDEVHVLPTIKVKEQPKIIEREIEFEKPVEIKQTIVHQEKPVIVEQPIIKQINEHYRDNTEYVKQENKIVNEINKSDNKNLENEALLNIRKEKLDTYNNTQPIVEHKKEKIQLDTEVREQPTVVNSKQTVYQQPIEIEQRYIEQVKPIVNEQVTINKEHIHEKLAPEHYVTDVKQINQGDQFYSKDLATGGVDAANALNNKARNEEQYAAGVSDVNEQRS